MQKNVESAKLSQGVNQKSYMRGRWKLVKISISSSEVICQTRKTMFYHISKHQKQSLKYDT